ncbi:MAG TPA: FAD-binding protein, partial [Spirochaetota bacterium]|nr:FAD-binding protein [Spirochaetota bacterium]
MKIYKNYPLAKLTTFKVGGQAEYFCKPKNLNETIDALSFSKIHNLSFFILGGGANLLISDNGIKGLVISTKKLRKISFENETSIRVQAGVSIKKLNKFLMKKGYSGLEFSFGLPGSAGGAVFMNARCYSKEF